MSVVVKCAVCVCVYALFLFVLNSSSTCLVHIRWGIFLLFLLLCALSFFSLSTPLLFSSPLHAVALCFLQFWLLPENPHPSIEAYSNKQIIKNAFLYIRISYFYCWVYWMVWYSPRLYFCGRSRQPSASRQQQHTHNIFISMISTVFFFLFFSPTLRTNFLHGSRIVVMYAFRCCCYSSCISFLTRSSSQIFIVDTHTFHTISLSFFIFLRCWDISWLTCSFKPKTNDEHYCYSCHFSCATKINWKRHDERYVCRNTPHHTHIRYIMSVEWV